MNLAIDTLTMAPGRERCAPGLALILSGARLLGEAAERLGGPGRLLLAIALAGKVAAGHGAPVSRPRLLERNLEVPRTASGRGCKRLRLWLDATCSASLNCDFF